MAGHGKAQYHANVPDTEPKAAMSEEPRFAHEVLAVVLQVRDQQLNVLLWRRGAAPFKGRWALPGGPLGAGERLGTSLGRHLATKVDLTDIAYLEQLETRSDPRRDPRGRTLATAYLALVAADRVRPRVHRGVGPRPAARQAVLHQHRLRPGPRDLHDRAAPRHLRRVGRPSGLGDQPAAGADPPGGDRGHGRGRPADPHGR